MYIAGGLVFTRAGIKRLLFLWPFLLIVLAWHLYSNTISEGFMIVFRLLAIIGLANLVTMTSRLENILDMINRFLSPLRRFGINTRPLELAIALLVRFTPVLTNKASALKDAWRARAVARPGWRLVFPLALQAIDDAENVSEALRARGGVQVQPAYTDAHSQQTPEKS